MDPSVIQGIWGINMHAFVCLVQLMPSWPAVMDPSVIYKACGDGGPFMAFDIRLRQGIVYFVTGTPAHPASK